MAASTTLAHPAICVSAESPLPKDVCTLVLAYVGFVRRRRLVCDRMKLVALTAFPGKLPLECVSCPFQEICAALQHVSTCFFGFAHQASRHAQAPCLACCHSNATLLPVPFADYVVLGRMRRVLRNGSRTGSVALPAKDTELRHCCGPFANRCPIFGDYSKRVIGISLPGLFIAVCVSTGLDLRPFLRAEPIRVGDTTVAGQLVCWGHSAVFPGTACDAAVSCGGHDQGVPCARKMRGSNPLRLCGRCMLRALRRRLAEQGLLSTSEAEAAVAQKVCVMPIHLSLDHPQSRQDRCRLAADWPCNGLYRAALARLPPLAQIIDELEAKYPGLPAYLQAAGEARSLARRSAAVMHTAGSDGFHYCRDWPISDGAIVAPWGGLRVPDAAALPAPSAPADLASSASRVDSDS